MKRSLDILSRVLFYTSLIALVLVVSSTLYTTLYFDTNKLQEMIMAKNIFGASSFVFFTTFFASIATILYNKEI